MSGGRPRQTLATLSRTDRGDCARGPRSGDYRPLLGTHRVVARRGCVRGAARPPGYVFPGVERRLSTAMSRRSIRLTGRSGVVVPKGTSRVVFRYEPRPFKVGVVLAAARSRSLPPDQPCSAAARGSPADAPGWGVKLSPRIGRDRPGRCDAGCRRRTCGGRRRAPAESVPRIPGRADQLPGDAVAVGGGEEDGEARRDFERRPPLERCSRARS